MAASRDLVFSRSSPRAQNAAGFVELSFGRFNGQSDEAIFASSTNPALVVRAGGMGTGDFDDAGTDIETLAAAYLGSIVEQDMLGQIAKYANILPEHVLRVMIASGFTANLAAEAAPKVVTKLALSIQDPDPVKPAAIIVMSDELARATGSGAIKMFERELAAAVTRASNSAVLDLLTPTAITVAGSGEPLADLRAGLRAAGPSLGYVVATNAGDAAVLATSVESKGMSIRGGTFVEGVEIVAVDGLEGMVIIPASRLSLRDVGLTVRSARHASVNMSDTPTAPSQLVSLFQNNLFGLLAERPFFLEVGATQAVIVEEA